MCMRSLLAGRTLYVWIMQEIMFAVTLEVVQVNEQFLNLQVQAESGTELCFT